MPDPAFSPPVGRKLHLRDRAIQRRPTNAQKTRAIRDASDAESSYTTSREDGDCGYSRAALLTATTTVIIAGAIVGIYYLGVREQRDPHFWASRASWRQIATRAVLIRVVCGILVGACAR